MKGAAAALPATRSDTETTDAMYGRRIGGSVDSSEKRIVFQCTADPRFPPIMASEKIAYRKIKKNFINVFQLHSCFQGCTFVHVFLLALMWRRISTGTRPPLLPFPLRDVLSQQNRHHRLSDTTRPSPPNPRRSFGNGPQHRCPVLVPDE
jgi:hypothetical protein